MATRTIRICESCESTGRRRDLRDQDGDRQAKLDLCGEHAAPLIDLLATAPAPAPAATPVDAEKAAGRAARRKEARERRAAEKAEAESGDAPAA